MGYRIMLKYLISFSQILAIQYIQIVVFEQQYLLIMNNFAKRNRMVIQKKIFFKENSQKNERMLVFDQFYDNQTILLIFFVTFQINSNIFKMYQIVFQNILKLKKRQHFSIFDYQFLKIYKQSKDLFFLIFQELLENSGFPKIPKNNKYSSIRLINLQSKLVSSDNIKRIESRNIIKQ
ncbi:hypothetical protein ABPG72_021849 [Tetrahymena utriculariae]